MLSRVPARAVGGVLLLGFLVLAVGCGGPDYKARAVVSGKVTFKDKPLTAGTVMFYGDHNITATASIGSDGVYLMRDAPIGDVRITVTVPKMPAGGMKHLKDAPKGPRMPGDPEPSPEEFPKEVVAIPPRYGQVETSGLKYTVTRGEQTYNIPLTP